jgi:hypothetical protein
LSASRKLGVRVVPFHWITSTAAAVMTGLAVISLVAALAG